LNGGCSAAADWLGPAAAAGASFDPRVGAVGLTPRPLHPIARIETHPIAKDQRFM
jgi:hypothetical protein